MVKYFQTKYIGIYRQLDTDDGVWFICDDTGCDECFDNHRPTDDDVDRYREDLLSSHRLWAN